jgi:hypothetical protein
LEVNVSLNIVMMGQGEPLLNLNNVIKATRLLTDPEGMAISPRRITLSPPASFGNPPELAREEVRRNWPSHWCVERRTAPDADADHAQIPLG